MIFSPLEISHNVETNVFISKNKTSKHGNDLENKIITFYVYQSLHIYWLGRRTNCAVSYLIMKMLHAFIKFEDHKPRGDLETMKVILVHVAHYNNILFYGLVVHVFFRINGLLPNLINDHLSYFVLILMKFIFEM